MQLGEEDEEGCSWKTVVEVGIWPNLAEPSWIDQYATGIVSVSGRIKSVMKFTIRYCT